MKVAYAATVLSALLLIGSYQPDIGSGAHPCHQLDGDDADERQRSM